tara:strand:- start:13 stop:249 length:237 start_codon:yes stop_codon:yes gene_type:complete
MYKPRTIEEMADHAYMLRERSPVMYQEMVNVWRKFSKGQDGGEFEPWNKKTIRETYYHGWSDEDFVIVLEKVGEPLEV